VNDNGNDSGSVSVIVTGHSKNIKTVNHSSWKPPESEIECNYIKAQTDRQPEMVKIARALARRYNFYIIGEPYALPERNAYG
jgi:hypothetical protein